MYIIQYKMKLTIKVLHYMQHQRCKIIVLENWSKWNKRKTRIKLLCILTQRRDTFWFDRKKKQKQNKKRTVIECAIFLLFFISIFIVDIRKIYCPFCIPYQGRLVHLRIILCVTNQNKKRRNLQFCRSNSSEFFFPKLSYEQHIDP